MPENSDRFKTRQLDSNWISIGKAAAAVLAYLDAARKTEAR